MSRLVLDASSLIAYFQDEPGADVVAASIREGAVISAANWAEVLSKGAEAGDDPLMVVERLTAQGLSGGDLHVFPVTDEDAIVIAQLRPLTRAYGLSLGDRACLALGIRLQLPVVTTDRAWATLGLSVNVRAIR